MSRSVWKGPFVDRFLLKKIHRAEKYARIKIWSRRSVIIPQFIGKKFEVYNGKKFVSIEISEDMVGHKLGEFSPTRLRAVHKDKKKLKKN